MILLVNNEDSKLNLRFSIDINEIKDLSIDTEIEFLQSPNIEIKNPTEFKENLINLIHNIKIT